jgi:hypothetical protein
MGCITLGTLDWSPSSDSRSSLGVFWSQDDGVTWDDRNGVLLPRKDPDDISLLGISIRRLRIDPRTPNTIFAATSQGVARSTDAGLHWKWVAPGVNAGDVEINPADSMIVYASSYSGGGTILRSTTGGTAGSFKPFMVGIPSPSTKFSRIELAISPADPDTLYAMASVSGRIQFAALFRTRHARDKSNPVSSDHGWHQRAARYFPLEAITIAPLVGTQAFANFAFAVSPTDANRLYVGGLDFLESGDGGETFWEEADWNPLLGHYIHADQWSIAFPPGGDGQVMFVGNDGGICKSTSGGDGIVAIGEEAGASGRTSRERSCRSGASGRRRPPRTPRNGRRSRIRCAASSAPEVRRTIRA